MRGRIAIFLVLATASAVTLSADQRPGRERQVLVSAALSSGAPATGLTVSDFIVREDGLSREITKVAPAPPLGLMTFGDRPTKRADFSPTSGPVEQAAGKIFATPGSPA